MAFGKEADTWSWLSLAATTSMRGRMAPSTAVAMEYMDHSFLEVVRKSGQGKPRLLIQVGANVGRKTLSLDIRHVWD
jgi:hypothetical protein